MLSQAARGCSKVQYACPWNHLQQIRFDPAGLLMTCCLLFNFLLTVTGLEHWLHCFHFSHRDTALLFCVTSMSLPVFVHAALKSNMLDCSLPSGLFWVVLFFLMLENDCECTEQESEVWHRSCSYLKWIKGVKIKPPIVDGRAWCE